MLVLFSQGLSVHMVYVQGVYVLEGKCLWGKYPGGMSQGVCVLGGKCQD